MKTLLMFLLLVVAASLCDAQNFWQQTNCPFSFPAYGRGIAANARNSVFTSDTIGILRSTDDGANWDVVNNGVPYIDMWKSWSFVCKSNGEIVGGSGTRGGEWGRVYLSTNDGNSWTCIADSTDSLDLPVTSLATNSFGHIFAGTSGTRYTEGFWGAVYRSTNNGTTWQNVLHDSGGVFQVAVDAAGRIFSSTGYWMTRGAIILRSTDNGNTWVRADSGLAYGFSVFAFNSQGHVLVNRNGFVYVSTNGGASWVPYDTLQGLISTMIFAPNGDFWVGTYSAGVFRNGVQVNSGLTDLEVTSLAISPNGFLYARTYAGGVFRSSQRVVAVERGGDEIPGSYFLEQNYPNPFNPTTTINYHLPTVSHVTLKVFDILGREVATLVDEVQEAGFKSVRFDAGNLASGVYVYRLQSGSFIGTRKMVVVR